jgi:hypothetical protein
MGDLSIVGNLDWEIAGTPTTNAKRNNTALFMNYCLTTKIAELWSLKFLLIK